MSKSSSKTEEIDLLLFFNNIGSFIVKIFTTIVKLVLHIILFTYRRWLILLSSAILGVLCSLALILMFGKKYKSELVLRSNTVPNQELIVYLDRLGDLTNKEDVSELSGLLKTTPEIASGIREVNAFWYIDKNSDGIVDDFDREDKFLNDTAISKLRLKFGLEAKVNDPLIFEVLTDGLISYIKDNEYFARMNTMRIENLNSIVEYFENEVDKLDSLQRKEYFRIRDDIHLREGQLIFTTDPDYQLFHEDLLELVREKMKNEAELSVHPDVVSILNDFQVSHSPYNDVLYYSQYLVPIFVLFGYLFAIILTYRKIILKFLNSGNN